jgi:microcystin degradation protein MlrC
MGGPRFSVIFCSGRRHETERFSERRLGGGIGVGGKDWTRRGAAADRIRRNPARRRPFHQVSDFTSLGPEPAKFKIAAVKAGYLVPEIEAIANPNLMALTDGSVNQDIENLSSKHRVPTYPFVRDLRWTPRAWVK